MRVNKKYIKKARKRTILLQKKTRNRKPLRPIFFQRNALAGGDVDWARTSPYMQASM